MADSSNPPRILVADDDSHVRRSLTRLLESEGWRVHTVDGGAEAIRAIEADEFDLVILDVIMPNPNGFETCRHIKGDDRTRLTPVILVTGLDAQEDRILGIRAGADDFLSKPWDTPTLIARVQSLLRLKHFTDELERSEKLIMALARAIEGRDTHTRGHCARLADLGSRLGRQMGLDDDDVLALRRGGTVHDLGKIAVPDAILLKSGPLTSSERAIMNQHPVHGAEICGDLRTFHDVVPIIRHHHERFDGSGYPDGLAGHDIPTTARVLQIVDIYDALTSDRPYRGALSPQRAIEELREERRRGWVDPEILATFEEMIAGSLNGGGRIVAD